MTVGGAGPTSPLVLDGNGSPNRAELDGGIGPT